MASISVEPNASPRIITILAPDTFISVQELINLIRDWEDDNLDHPHLTNASGKDDLGGGTAVGITMQLQNARIAFEARPGPSYVQCTIAGGNTVAYDPNGDPIDPIEPTAFTQVVLAQSSSPTIVNTELSDQVTQIKYMIESLRTTHQGFGSVFFVDPVDGNDSLSGVTPDLAKATIASALASVQSGRGDVIYLIGPSAGVVNITENVVINKEDVHIRGPGRGVCFQPASGVPIIINSSNCSLSGFIIKTPTLSNYNCLEINGSYIKCNRIYLIGAGQGIGTGHGILINAGDYHEFFNIEVESCGGSGIFVTDALLPVGPPKEVWLEGCNFYLNGRSGVEAFANPGAPYSSTCFLRFHDCSLFNNLRYGVEINTDVCGTQITDDCDLFNNTLGDILDSGTQTFYLSMGKKVWNHPTGNEEQGSVGKRVKDIKTYTQITLVK